MADRVDILRGHLATKLTSGVSHGTAQYRYTLDTSNGIISEAQRAQYEAQGFLVIRNLVDKEKLDRCRNRFQEICQMDRRKANMIVMRDVAIAQSEYKTGEKAITKLQNFQDDPVLFEYCKLPELLQYVRCFMGDNINSMHTMLINKPPDPGKGTSRHPMHQDLHYFPFRPADRIVCSWTAMQDVNRQNGCHVVVPGSHRTPGTLLEHGYPKWESISGHFAAGECEYIDVTNTSQQWIEQEIKEMVLKKADDKSKEKINKHFTLKDVWKHRQRLVHGESVSLQ